MLYKLSIKPTRLELLKLVSLDKSKYKEIRVAVRPLPFRFNRGIIDSDEFFQQFVDIVNDFLETYRPDISSLYVALKENYFQVYDIPMPEYNEELIQWEIGQYLIDDISSYRYGIYHHPSENKVHIVIARTKLIDYFQKVFKSIYGTINFNAIGFDLKSTRTETIFIKTDQVVTDYYRFGYASSWNPENDIVAPKNSFKKLIIIISSIVAVLIFLILALKQPNPEIKKPLPTTSAAKNSDGLVTAAKPNDSLQTGTAQPSAKTTTANNPNATSNVSAIPAVSKDCYSLISKIVTTNFNILVVNKNSCHLEYNSIQDLDQVSKFVKTADPVAVLKVSGKSKNILSFNLTDASFYQSNLKNRQYYDKLSDKFGVFSKNNYKLFNNLSAISAFIKEMQSSKLQFSHLVISHRGNLYILAVEFI